MLLFVHKLGLHGRSLELQIPIVVSLAPRQIDRGDIQWHYWEDTEAGKYRSWSCWRKVTALFLPSSVTYYLLKVNALNL